MPRSPLDRPQDIARRNAALLSLDRATILVYLKNALDPIDYELFSHAADQSFWRTVHLTRLVCRGIPVEARTQSHAWLKQDARDRGLLKKD